MISWKLYLYKLISLILPETRCFGLKVRLLRWCGAKIGHNVRINSSVHISGVGKLLIGDDVWIGPRTLLISGCPATVSIGSHVDIGPDVCIVTGSHEIDTQGSHVAGRGYNTDVVIEDGAWIGCRATILPGVTIGQKTVIGAGSLVVRDVPSKCVAYGVPARLARNY